MHYPDLYFLDLSVFLPNLVVPVADNVFTDLRPNLLDIGS